MDRRNALKTLGGAAALALNLPAFAQDAKYGTRQVRMIVPYPPGGVIDLAGRMASEVLTAHYGQAVVVENRPGGNGLIGLSSVARAPADGYTLVTGGLGSNVIPPATIQGLPLDIMASFSPIAQIAEFVNVLVVSADSPVRTAQDLLEMARTKGANAVSYGSNGVGTSAHLTAALLAQTEKVELMHIPYKGSTEILVDVANGNLDFCFNNLPPVLPMLQSGKIRAIAVTSPYRSKQLPDVPTMQEAGVAGFSVTSWLGVYGPAGMDAGLVKEIGDTIVQGLSTPEYTRKLELAGFEPRPADAATFARLNQDEFTRWRDIAAQANVSLTFGST